MRCLLFTLCLVSFNMMAQEPYLFLNKIGRTTRVKFVEGERIRFKMKSDDVYTSGKITGFGNDLIKVNNVIVPIDSIDIVDIRHKNFSQFSFRSVPGKLGAAGFLYVGIDWFNRRVVSGEKGGIDKRVALVSAGLSFSGVLLKIIQKKYFRVGGRNTITVIKYNK